MIVPHNDTSGENALTGSIPSEIGLLTNLKYSFLDNNDLSGEIPSEIGKLTGVKILYLSK